MKYRVVINDRKYSKWTFINTHTEVETELPEINPLQMKLFSKDIIENGKTVYSQIKTGIRIPGILMLYGNKTYGRTTNKKRLLYRCIPNDDKLPIFLVPYEIKLGFTKSIQNKYVIFKFVEWIDQHPHGQLLETIGDVSNLNSLYEYQLYCKSLHISISEFTNQTKEQLHKKTLDEYIQQIQYNPHFSIEDRKQTYKVFTIDPKNSNDYDDGFSIIKTMNDSSCSYIVSIYIANVYFWLETLGLWTSFSNRVATIYLPDKRCPMLPNILSDSLCSLQANESRFAFVMDIHLSHDGKIIKTEYKNAVISVYCNYCYDDPHIHNDPNYQYLYEITKLLDPTTKNSHDIVAYWMIQMNSLTGKHMASSKTGIFRSVLYDSTFNPCIKDMPSNMNDDVYRVIRQWNNTTGQYMIYSENIIPRHDIMELTSYIHITSPIRRLVDLLNLMLLMKTTLSIDANAFLNKWINELDFINQSMRSIRKIQMECTLLDRCFKDPTIMERDHGGIVFDKMQKNDGTYVYMVYLEELKLLTRINTHFVFENYTRAQFRTFLFEDEDKIKRKIRLHYQEPIHIF